MNRNESQIEQLEQQLANAKELTERKQRIMRLSLNPDFRNIVMQEFCVFEAARYAHASGDAALTAEQRADSLAMAQAGGHLKRWMSIQLQMAARSEADAEEIERMLVELHSGSGTEDNSYNEGE
jgi:hypothetical protein